MEQCAGNVSFPGLSIAVTSRACSGGRVWRQHLGEKVRNEELNTLTPAVY
jgi:hypothetical protein